MSADRFEAGPCRLSEMKALRALLNEVFITERNSDGDLFEFAPLLYSEENVENLRVVRKGKRIVGHAGILPRPIRWRGQTFAAGLIGGVCAREELRGHGIGTLAMKSAEERMEELGLDFGVLWTGSHGFYQRLGWRLAGGITVMGIQEAAGELAQGDEIMPLHESPFGPDECHRLHEKAGRHEVVRTAEENARLMSTAGRTTWIALEGGRLVGYATTTAQVVQEIEGNASARIALLEHAASQGLRRCVFPLNDPQLEAIGEALPVSVEPKTLGMFLIVNRAGLVEKIVAETSDGVAELGIGTNVSNDTLTANTFGGPEREPADEPLPLDLHIGYLDHV